MRRVNASAKPRLVPTPPAWNQQLFTVGVTGTNGKTTTTAWVAAALAALGRPIARDEPVPGDRRGVLT
jgi:UDP-N-acetylmuramyl pentapeptide synthase